MATDCDFLLDVLKDHAWHSTAELLRYSIEERGCGMTVHSRVSDLRARGLNVEYRRVKGERAQAHQYRLVAVRESDHDSLSGLAAGRSHGPLPAADGPVKLDHAGPVLPTLGSADEPAQLSFEAVA